MILLLVGTGCKLSGVMVRNALRTSGQIVEMWRRNQIPSRQRYSILLNWGSSVKPNIRADAIVQSVEAVKLAANKKRALDFFGALAPPNNDINIYPARFPVYLRTTHHTQGRGLKIVHSIEEFMENRANYTHWVENVHTNETIEYRVHVFRNELIHRQRKDFSGTPTPEQLAVRNYHNGWKFITLNTIPPTVATVAKRAVSTLNLTWGGVDVIYNGSKAWVLEVNTAPSLRFPLTLQRYINKIQEYVI